MSEPYYETNWNRASYLVHFGFQPYEAVPYEGTFAVPFDDGESLRYTVEQYKVSEYYECNNLFKSVIMPNINKARNKS